MPKLNPISGKKMAKILIFLEFKELRIKGSHHFFFNPNSRKTATIPIHKNENLSVGILKEILRDIELPVDDYEKLRQKM